MRVTAIEGGALCVILRAVVDPGEAARGLILAAGPHTRKFMPKSNDERPNVIFRQLEAASPAGDGAAVEKTFALVAFRKVKLGKVDAVRMGLELLPKHLEKLGLGTCTVTVADSRDALSIAKCWPELDRAVGELSMSVHSLEDIPLSSTRKSTTGNVMTSWHRGKRRVNIYRKWCIGSRDWVPYVIQK